MSRSGRFGRHLGRAAAKRNGMCLESGVGRGTSWPSGKRCERRDAAILNNCLAKLQKYAFRPL
jgi:hypothetical protein